MKKYFFFRSLCWLTVFSTILILSCANLKTKKADNEISVTNWNVQTFFDGNIDGKEYSEFRKSKENWNEEFYEERLKRLCKIISEIDSDIFVMEELENEKILYDISNRLSGNVWFNDKRYDYAAFANEKDNSIGCGIISKLKIDEVKIHALDIRTESEKSPSMRSVMEVTLETASGPVTMYVNHWKSKSGGEEKTEKWRLWQENVLARELSSCKESVSFACGDFNKDISDFNYSEDGELQFAYLTDTECARLKMSSPWRDDDNYGSYYFRGKWEKIDHFFSPAIDLPEPQISLKEFQVVQIPEITNQDGTPNRYELFNHKGYSDHLPITCKVVLKDDQKKS